MGTRVVIATAEDVVLAKLEWAKLGESRRQIQDAAGILKTLAGQLDLEYLRNWVRDLSLGEQWDAASRSAQSESNTP